MSDWSLEKLLASLHNDIEQRLKTIRETMGHPTLKGDASEGVWCHLFNEYLPRRYRADRAHVVDSKGQFSQQVDVVIYDRQYSPFIFRYAGQKFVPAESVYAVFEAKQSANVVNVRYAHEKVRSVRRLHRTSLPIPHESGTSPAKELIPILGGLLTLESDWSPPLGNSFLDALNEDQEEGRLDIGCVAAHGYFQAVEKSGTYAIHQGGKAATAFLFQLISQLQSVGTVQMIDIQAYGKSLPQ